MCLDAPGGRSECFGTTQTFQSGSVSLSLLSSPLLPSSLSILIGAIVESSTLCDGNRSSGDGKDFNERSLMWWCETRDNATQLGASSSRTTKKTTEAGPLPQPRFSPVDTLS